MRSFHVPSRSAAVSLYVVAILVIFSRLTAQQFIGASKFRVSSDAVRNEWIVVLNDAAAGPRGAQSRAEVVGRSLTQTYGGTLKSVYRHALNGFSLDAPESVARRLSENPSVSWVESVLPGHVGQPPPLNWNRDRINQRTLPLDGQSGLNRTGVGTNIYIIDTGIRATHQDFGGRVSFAVDTVNDGQNGNDCYGHGTMSAGVAGGTQYGVAKQAHLWNVRVFGCVTATTAMGIAGIDWVTANHLPRSVASMSLLYPPSAAIELAVQAAISSGVTFVASAGNLNQDAGIYSPGRGVAGVLLIGATDSNDQRSWFSNFGPLVDLFAPGQDFHAPGPQDDVSPVIYGGTSGAAPHVGGAAALYLEAFPGATPAQVHDALVSSATNGVVSDAGPGSPNRLLFATVRNRAPTDFDSDSKTDVAVYRPSNGTWYILRSSTGFTGSALYTLGQGGDLPVPGDYDGDGQTDFAVYRPSSGHWFIQKSTSYYTAGVTYQLGVPGDVTVPADFDGDRKTDVAVYRPSSGQWFVLTSSTGFTSSLAYTLGQGGDLPVQGDYDGDGKSDVAVYRPSSGHWFILKSSTNYTALVTYQWGSGGDVAIPGDFDGDRRADVVVYRPSSGHWFILKSSTNYTFSETYQLGGGGDVPVPGDFDGDGRADVVVYRPQSGHWFILKSTSNYNVLATYQWGATGDIPVREGL